MRQVREVFFPFDCKPFQGSGQRQLPYTVQFMTQNVSQAWKLSWIWFACGYDFHFQFFFLVLVLVFALVERVAMINKKNNIEIF